VSYKNNVRDGASKWYFQRFSTLVNEDRVNVEYTYKNGVLEGPQKTFYRSAKLESIVNSVNNLEEGEFHTYFENGKDKIIGKYIHGKKDGVWKEFNEDGKVTKTEIYKNGELKK
jgi:antitoxin component YwqK of YwqJK toxin-antitoxin module